MRGADTAGTPARPPRRAAELLLVLAAGISAVLLICARAQAAPAPLGTFTEFSLTTNPGAPLGIAAGPDGNLWFTEQIGDKIGRITPSGTITEFPVPTPGSQPGGIAAGPDGNMWFTELQGAAIGRITPSGTITEFPVPTGTGSQPYAITAGPDGNMWFTELAGDKIGRITPSGAISEFATPAGASSPLGIAAGPDGDIWFTEQGSDRIGRIIPSQVSPGTSDGIVDFPVPTSASEPGQIAAGPDGNMWFTEQEGNNIGRISPSGTITEFPVPTANADPFGIAAGPDGDMWFTESGGNIGRISPSGTITEFPAPTGAGLEGIAPGPDGNLWFTTIGANKVGLVGAGVPAASVRAPSVTGSGQQGTQQLCQGDVWAQWANQPPSYTAFSFDGYQWLRDGSPIPGATGQAYSPTVSDVGHTLACMVTVTYPLLDVTTSSTSVGVTVIAQSSGPTGPQGPSAAPGPAGPVGPVGPVGPAGRIELVTCSTVTVTVKHHKVKRQNCKGRLVTGPVTFTTQAGDRASLARGRVLYASGEVTRIGGDRTALALVPSRALRPGRYTLTIRLRRAEGWINRRTQITMQ